MHAYPTLVDAIQANDLAAVQQLLAEGEGTNFKSEPELTLLDLACKNLNEESENTIKLVK